MEKIEVSLDSEFLNRMDKVVELLAFNNRKELVCYVIRKYVEKYHSTYARASKRP